MTDLPKPVIAIPLRVAMLCMNDKCEAIFYGTANCSACGDTQALPLEKIIGTIRTVGGGGSDPAPGYDYPLSRGD